MKTFVSCVGLVLSFAACAASPVATLRAELQGLNLESPEADAARDLAARAAHCYSINGFARSFPGVETSAQRDFCSSVEKNFAGTSDVVHGKEHGQLIAQAAAYAKRYNVYVLSHRP